MPRVAWTLTDYSTGSPVVYQFPINPNEFAPPGRRAGIIWNRVSAPNGSPIFFQGLDDPPTGSMQGAVNSALFRADLDEWFNKYYPLELTTDLGDVWGVLFQNVSWTRLKRVTNPHRYDYKVDFMVIT